MILETAVERARVGCHGVFWQGATTLRATARKEKQRRQSAPGRLNRVGSVVTQKVKSFVSTEVSVHAALQAEVSGQLRFLGSFRRRCRVGAAPPNTASETWF